MSEQQQPVSFAEKAKRAASGVGGYPIQISAEDLDKNFTWCALQIDPDKGIETESATGLGGWPTTKIRLISPPASGTHVLGAIDGVIQWIETEEC